MLISIFLAAGYKADRRSPKLWLRGALFPSEATSALHEGGALFEWNEKSYKLINIMVKDNSDGKEFTSDKDVKDNIAGLKTIRWVVSRSYR